MDEKKMKRAGIVAIAVPALTVGTVALVSAYQAGNDFQPFNTDRELQKNQVVFSDDEEAAGEQEQQQGEDDDDDDAGKDKSKDVWHKFLLILSLLIRMGWVPPAGRRGRPDR